MFKNYSLIKSDKNSKGSLIFDEYPRTSLEKNINAIYNYNLNIDELKRLTFLDTSKNCLGSNNTKMKNTDSICNL